MSTLSLQTLVSKGVRISKNHNGKHWGWLFEFKKSGETLFFADEDAAPGAGGSYRDYPYTEDDERKINSLAS